MTMVQTMVNAQDTDPASGNLFTPGPKGERAPQGNAQREAIDALRGYAYQIATSALAWLSLGPSERLYLEVAEDYAICAGDAIKAVQVKDTAQSGNVTLKSEDVKEALENFVDLVEKNPGQKISLHFLTTSEIGIEKAVADRPNGKAGLKYWRSVAASGDITPLRKVLSGANMPAKLKAFVDARDDEMLRNDLLKRIHWNCGSADFSQVQIELELGIAQTGRQHYGTLASAAKQISFMVMYHVLQKSTLKDREKRVLIADELTAILDSASRISLRQKDYDALTSLVSGTLAALGGGNATAVAVGGRPPWVFLEEELIRQPLTIERRTFETRICTAMSKSPSAVLYGSTGLGKTLLARTVTAHLKKTFALIELRDLDSNDIPQRLDPLVPHLHNLKVDAIIFDDLNHLENPSVKASFGRVLASLRRRDQFALVTCYRGPSASVSSNLAIPPENVFEVPYFSEDEVNDLVGLAGGDPSKWGKVAMLAGGQGHPQLVKAFVLGAAARNWPQSELAKIVQTGFTSTDIVALRDEARRRLIEELEKDSQTLLFRTSFVIGSFVRGLAIRLGDVSPRLVQAGRTLDKLAGSWIEIIDSERFRISPLLAGAGAKVLGEDESRAVHSAIARYLVKDRQVSVTNADAILMHGLAGRDSSVLMALATATTSAPEAVLKDIAEYTFALPNLKTDGPIFPDHPGVSALLRLAHCRVILAKGVDEKVDAAVDALFREIDALKGELRSGVEVISLINLLSVPGSAGRIAGWLSLIKRFSQLLASNRDLAERIERPERPKGHEHRSIRSGLLVMGLSRMPSVKKLEKFFFDLNQMTANDRDDLLAEFEQSSSDYDLIVSGAWLAEQNNGTLDWADSAERYLRLAEMATNWKHPALAAYCYKSRAVMIDEYGNDPNAALTSLDVAAAKLGESNILLRERVKVLWRRNDYREVVELMTPVADALALDSPIERMFVLREGAISAANIGDWARAAKWFHGAAQTIEEGKRITPPVIGLGVDEAIAEFNIGNRKRCIELLAKAIIDLSAIENDQSIRAVYCKHLVRHAVLWVQMRIQPLIPNTLPYEIIWLPGSGSNPQPPEAFRDQPLGPIDLVWYLLAEAEIMSNVDAGIFRNLRSCLQRGPVQFQEITIRKKLIDAAILRTDSVQFAKHFHGHLEGLAFLLALPQDYRQKFDVMNPARGEIPTVSVEQLAENEKMESAAVEAILAFAISASLSRNFDSISQAEQKLVSEFGIGFPGRNAFARLCDEGSKLNPLCEVVIRIIGVLKMGTHLVPYDVCGIGLRFSDFVRQSHFRYELTPMLADWLMDRWRSILENERFRLKRPALNLPQIERILDNSDQAAEQKLASLLLAGCDAAGVELADEYIDLLRRQSQPPVKPSHPSA